MKPTQIIAVMTAVLLLWACVPKMPPVKIDPAYQLFSNAEKMFQAKAYEKALAGFSEYLERFPDRPLADAALMKMGSIFSALGDNESARNTYQRLIVEYPDSFFVYDAGYETIVTYYNEGEYKKVIEQTADFLKLPLSRALMLKTNLLLGDTYQTLGSQKDAVNYYVMAFKEAKDLEKNDIVAKLKDAIPKLALEDIESLLSGLEDDLPKAYLMFQMGLNDTEAEKYDEALKVLSAFTEKFPFHENIPQAKRLIDAIRKKSVYSRYTIGCLLPLSGPYEIYGNRALKGIELALNQFSSQNRPSSIKIIFKDTASNSDTAVAAVKELFDENVAAIIGPVITAESAAIAAQNKGIPIITLTQKDHIPGMGDYVFRNFMTPGMQVKALVSYAVGSLGLKRFAILYPDEKYGTTFMNLFWDEVIAHGGEVVGVESYKPAYTDFADPIKKLVGLYYEVPEELQPADEGVAEAEENDTTMGDTSEKPIVPQDEEAEDISTEENEKPQAVVDFDAVFIPDAPKKTGLIIPHLAFFDVKDTYLLGTNLWHSDRLIEMARQYVQGAIMPDGFFAESASEKVKQFVGNYQEVFHEKPGFIEAVAYDTATILFQVVSEPDIRYRSALKNVLKRLSDFQGVTGGTSFNNDGDVRKNIYLLQVRGNRFVELEYR